MVWSAPSPISIGCSRTRSYEHSWWSGRDLRSIICAPPPEGLYSLLPTISFPRRRGVVRGGGPGTGARELVVHLASQGTRLPKPKVMDIGRPPAADETRLRTHEVAMRFVAFADRLECVLILLHRG